MSLDQSPFVFLSSLRANYNSFTRLVFLSPSDSLHFLLLLRRIVYTEEKEKWACEWPSEGSIELTLRRMKKEGETLCHSF